MLTRWVYPSHLSCKQTPGGMCPSLQQLWGWRMVLSCPHHVSWVPLRLETMRWLWIGHAGSTYTVHPAPPLGVTRVFSPSWFPARCVCWHPGVLLIEVPPGPATLSVFTYSLLPLLPSGASHQAVAIPSPFLSVFPFTIIISLCLEES